MTDDRSPKKPKKEPKPLDMAFSEALVRFIQTDPKELQDEFDKIRQEDEEAKRYVEERRDSIRKGARRVPKRFRF